MEKLGGGLLERTAPAALGDGALDSALAKLDGVTPFERPRAAMSRDATPAPLRAYLGGDLAACAGARWDRTCPMRRCSSAAT